VLATSPPEIDHPNAFVETVTVVLLSEMVSGPPATVGALALAGATPTSPLTAMVAANTAAKNLRFTSSPPLGRVEQSALDDRQPTEGEWVR
jgi:hypothetical protein